MCLLIGYVHGAIEDIAFAWIGSPQDLKKKNSFGLVDYFRLPENRWVRRDHTFERSQETLSKVYKFPC